MRFWKKKDKRPYPRSFAKRLTWRIMFRMLIFMGIPTFLVFWLAYGLVFVGATTICERLVHGEHEEIRRISSDLYVASVNTAPVIEDNLDQPDKMKGIVERILKKNPYMRSCGISFVDNYYPKKGRRFYPYAVRLDSTTIETHVLSDAKHDYLNEAWFQEALSRNEGYWGKGFVDTTEQQIPLIAYQMPIHDKQDRTVAILRADLSLDWLNDKIQFMKGNGDQEGKQDTLTTHVDENGNWKSEYAAYFFMVDTTGTLLIHPDQKRILTNNIKEYVTKDPENSIQKMLHREKDSDEDVILNDEKVVISFRPVKYTNWCLALVIPKFFVDVFSYAISGILILIILIGMLAVYIFGRRTIKKATRPLIQLAASADEVAKGNFGTPLPEVKSHDEIHQLRDSFGQMQQSLTRYIEELRDTTAQKASFESELKIAHDIQMSMLPKTFPPYPERDDIDIYGTLTPAKAVGGDLFDFHIRDNQLFFCIGDVSGKGIPASLFMSVTRSLFRNISIHVAYPERIAFTLNNALTENNDTSMFVTLFTGVLDLATGHLRYCNAGHNSPLLVGRDVGELPCQPNLPLGIMANYEFEAQEVNLDPQTTIFLFTDGLNEAENAAHEQFGNYRIASVAKRLLATGSHQPLNLAYEMYQAVHQFVAGAEQSDDLTMLAIQYTGSKKQEARGKEQE